QNSWNTGSLTLFSTLMTGSCRRTFNRKGSTRRIGLAGLAPVKILRILPSKRACPAGFVGLQVGVGNTEMRKLPLRRGGTAPEQVPDDVVSFNRGVAFDVPQHRGSKR